MTIQITSYNVPKNDALIIMKKMQKSIIEICVKNSSIQVNIVFHLIFVLVDLTMEIPKIKYFWATNSLNISNRALY